MEKTIISVSAIDIDGKLTSHKPFNCKDKKEALSWLKLFYNKQINTSTIIKNESKLDLDNGVCILSFISNLVVRFDIYSIEI